jgi:hypothetical protein
LYVTEEVKKNMWKRNLEQPLVFSLRSRHDAKKGAMLGLAIGDDYALCFIC